VSCLTLEGPASRGLGQPGEGHQFLVEGGGDSGRIADHRDRDYDAAAATHQGGDAQVRAADQTGRHLAQIVDGARLLLDDDRISKASESLVTLHP
jgi:hypothetical protein